MRCLALDEFSSRTGIDCAAEIMLPDGVEGVVSPRDLASVSSVTLMPNRYRDLLLGSVGIAYNRDRKAYKGCSVHFRSLDPSTLVVGQKYVYRPNYISIVEGVRNTFKGFGMRSGFTRFIACILIGRDREGRTVMAHYLPPIVERHGAAFFLMDGVHRTYLARQAGVSIECLVVENVGVTFPCTPHPWPDVRVVDEKPADMTDRYWDLDAGFFRDVKFVGIDG